MYVWYQNVILGYIDQSLPAYIRYDSMTCRNPLTRLMFSPIRQMPRRMASALTVKRMRPRWNPIPTFLACPTGRLRSSAGVNRGGGGWEKTDVGDGEKAAMSKVGFGEAEIYNQFMRLNKMDMGRVVQVCEHQYQSGVGSFRITVLSFVHFGAPGF